MRRTLVVAYPRYWPNQGNRTFVCQYIQGPPNRLNIILLGSRPPKVELDPALGVDDPVALLLELANPDIYPNGLTIVDWKTLQFRGKDYLANWSPADISKLFPIAYSILEKDGPFSMKTISREIGLIATHHGLLAPICTVVKRWCVEQQTYMLRVK